MTVIDAHAHIYPAKIAERAVSSVGDFYNLQMDGEGTAEACLRVCEATPITNFIVHSVAVKPSNVESINDFIAQECAAHPEFIGFATMHQDYPDKEAEVNRAIELGLHGFKLHPDTQKVDMDDPRLMEFYEIVAGRLPVVIHTGDYRYGYSHPSRLKRILAAFPELKVDAAHFGGWSIFEIGYDILHNDNVFVDTSSSLPLMGTRRAEELIKLWGADRVMFGSDFPMWNQAEELQAIMRMSLPEDYLEKVLWRTAERFAGVTVA